VLDGLGIEDARAVFRAIRQANPGGLGRSARHDVSEEPTVGLAEAMAEAAARDRIAWNYVNGLADVFGNGLPQLRALDRRGVAEGWAMTGVYLRFLATLEDSHVSRKWGEAVAREVRALARGLDARVAAAGSPEALLPELLAFDTTLKVRGINPGTCADLTVACAFAARLS
jgi:triphosphoribosyl-dephospho-CoA synthase